MLGAEGGPVNESARDPTPGGHPARRRSLLGRKAQRRDRDGRNAPVRSLARPEPPSYCGPSRDERPSSAGLMALEFMFSVAYSNRRPLDFYACDTSCTYRVTDLFVSPGRAGLQFNRDRRTHL